MSHARIEEVSDSDPEIDDPSDYLPENDDLIIRPAHQPSQHSPAPSIPQSQRPNPTLFRPSISQDDMLRKTPKEVKQYQCLYPIYFDRTRSKAQGRRVSKDLAIPNPLAWHILSAIRSTVGENVLRIAFEPEKTHPKDWANPGRVKIQLKDADNDNRPLHNQIKSKAHLYTVIGKWLKENPTTKDSPLDLRLPGLPIPENFRDNEIVVPRGWKMGKVLPVHSNAVSGGGVKDDFFKEAMEEIEAAKRSGQLPPGGGGMPDMSALQNMMSMGGMGGLGNMLGGGSGGGGSGGGDASGKKKKDKKKG